jgi:Na+-driven multidrug efflux pump
VYFFNRKPEVVEYGTLLLRWITPFYLVCCFTQVYAGALRGAGNSQAPMVMMLTSFVAFRQAYLFVMSRVWNEVLPIAMAYPVGWILCTVLMTIYYHRYKSRLGEKLLVEDKP